MTTRNHPSVSPPVAASNPCKLCAPLGASLVFKGIASAMLLLHGSQGCSTYIRRYLIGHFREPIDIASSGFSEETTIFGGAKNLKIAIDNIVRQYHPEIIGIATTCLAETIGEDIGMYLKNLDHVGTLPPFVQVNCPSYAGTHIDGFRNTVKALVGTFAQQSTPNHAVTVYPGLLSCAELRHIRYCVEAYATRCLLVPDYSVTLDGGIWDEYQLIPDGGTTLKELTACGDSCASIEFSGTGSEELLAGKILEAKCGVPPYVCGLPLGIDACDTFFRFLGEITEKEIPDEFNVARRRLIDTYVDGHKFITGKRVAIFGDEDRVIALAGFCNEIGMKVSAVMTGGMGRDVASRLAQILPDTANTTALLCDTDFEALSAVLSDDPPDILIGSSKGYRYAHQLGIPLVRTGFPVHDRIGGQHLMHLGYEGTMVLFENIVNALIEHSQNTTNIGYMTW